MVKSQVPPRGPDSLCCFMQLPVAFFLTLDLLLPEQEEITLQEARGGDPGMSVRHGTLIGLGILLLSAGFIMASTSFSHSVLLTVLGITLGVGGMGLLVTGVRMAMNNVQVTVPGHYLLHPRTGTRFNPQQALAIQRRLDRMRREMSADSVTRTPEPELSLPSTPPPWTMEPPPSYDMVMNSQENNEQL